MQNIERLLRKEIGLDAASIGSSLIERIIRLRMEHHGVADIGTYNQLVKDSPDELEELIEAVVVRETWFFRDREPFNAFTQIALGEWFARRPRDTMRILSVPCSSGEEPYSIAMALLDAGVAEQSFEIDAVDISASALVRAQRAIYGKNSFRGKELAFRERHFQYQKEGYVLSQPVRRRVTFRRENVLDETFLAGSAPYDFIFCRNLLIYFDRATQSLTLSKLHQMLTADGVLFVGPAEMALVNESGFTSANLPHAFACRKSSGENTSPAKKSRRKKARPAVPPFAILTSTSDKALKVSSAKSSVSGPEHLKFETENSLQIARAYADTGQLEEARTICHSHITQNGPNAEAYYLLGLVSDATDNPDAITFYRKAIYLEPDHYESLVHIASWLEKNGDPESALPFKRRAERQHAKLSADSSSPSATLQPEAHPRRGAAEAGSRQPSS